MTEKNESLRSHVVKAQDVLSELQFSTSRSSGPGGQNVNKVNTKVTIRFDVVDSRVLTDEEKEILMRKLSNKLTTDGLLIISSQEKRSQSENKESALAKLDKILAKAFTVKKKRKKTKPNKGAVQKRIESKKKVGEKKKWRQKL